MSELGELKIFGDSAYRGGNHSHCLSYGEDPDFNAHIKSVHMHRMELYLLYSLSWVLGTLINIIS
jgi:hypothetical protein